MTENSEYQAPGMGRSPEEEAGKSRTAPSRATVKEHKQMHLMREARCLSRSTTVHIVQCRFASLGFSILVQYLPTIR